MANISICEFKEQLTRSRPTFDPDLIISYSGKTKPIRFICNTHGEVELKQAKSLLNGSNCPACAKINRKTSIRKDQTHFIKKATECHGNRYDYSKSVYHKMVEPITISCRIHGDFTQRPVDHINSQNCPTCANIARGKHTSDRLKGKPANNKGCSMSDEQKNDLSIKAKARIKLYGAPMQGKHHSSETKKILSIKSKAMAGTKIAKDRTISGINTRKNRGDDLAFFRGKRHTDEAKQSISEAVKRYWATKEQDTKKRRLEFINKANVTLLSSSGEKDYWQNIECNICKLNFTVHKQAFTNSKFKPNLCPNCYPRETKRSVAELEIGKFVESLDIDILVGNRKIIYPLELDIVIPDAKIAIEYCGLYWHSEKNGKDKSYHLNKTKLCSEQGITLITIFEDEWVHNRPIVENMLRAKLMKTPSLCYARSCEIKEVPVVEAKEFATLHHIQGYTNSSIKLGLYHKNILVSLMTFARPSIARGGKGKDFWELSRFCSTGRIPGAASKILTHFKNNYNPSMLVTYADLRWSVGNLYEKLGFTLIHTTPPNYWYITGTIRKHRFGLRKGIIAEDDLSLTEWQNRQNQGWDRIWDCGNLRFEWHKSPHKT